MDWNEFWQQVKEVGKVSDHISIKEYQCHHCHRLPPEDDHYLGQYIPFSSIMDALDELFESFEKLRDMMGIPIPVTSGYRCKRHQDELRELGYKAALVSPHNFGVALDITFSSIELNMEAYKLLTEEVNPNLRVGFWKYQKELIHLDTAYNLILTDDLMRVIGDNIYQKLLRNYRQGVRW